MARRFRLRLSRVIPSFQNCRSKDDAGVADTTPAFRLSPVNHKALDIDFPSPPSPAAPAFLCHHPPVVSAGGHFSGAGADAKANNFPPAGETPAYPWRKEEKWHIVAYAAGGGCGGDGFPSSRRRKIDSDDGVDIFPSAVMARARQREAERRCRRRLAEVRRLSRSCAQVSTSLADNGWFSSEGDEENDERESSDYFNKEDDYETETLVSSTDCSSDNMLRRGGMRRWRRREVVKHCPSPKGVAAAVLRRLVPCGSAAVVEEGKVRESFTMVKQLEDP